MIEIICDKESVKDDNIVNKLRKKSIIVSCIDRLKEERSDHLNSGFRFLAIEASSGHISHFKSLCAS